MSKFLKFIVHFFVICTIVCVLGLALPPFFIMDSSDKATNLPVGSVTYAIPVKTEDVAAGTPILVQEDGKSYRYNLVSVNRENNTGTVIDTTTSAQQNITVSVKNWVPKIVVTIPFVGYLLVATESIEGLIILGLVVLFLIILYVIAELWKKEPDDIEEDVNDPEPGYVKSRKELKQEEKARAIRMKEEEKEIIQEEKARKHKNKKADKRKVRTGGFVDEIDEEDVTGYSENKKKAAIQQTAQTAASEAHAELKKEIAAATSEEADMLSRLEMAERTVEENRKPHPAGKVEEVPEEEEEPVTIGSLAMPSYSAAQLASRVKKAGDAPDIVKDDITKVTLFDYSDIISGDVDDMEE